MNEKIQAVLPVTSALEFKCAYVRQLEIAVVRVCHTKELIPYSQHRWLQLLMVLATQVIGAESFLRRYAGTETGSLLKFGILTFYKMIPSLWLLSVSDYTLCDAWLVVAGVGANFPRLGRCIILMLSCFFSLYIPIFLAAASFLKAFSRISSLCLFRELRGLCCQPVPIFARPLLLSHA